MDYLPPPESSSGSPEVGAPAVAATHGRGTDIKPSVTFGDALFDFQEAGRHVALKVDRASAAKLKRKAMSASTMASMESCPARWAAEKLIDATPDVFAPTEIGTAGHSVLEELMQLPAPDRTLSQALLFVNRAAYEVFPLPPDGGFDAHESERVSWTVAVTNGVSGYFDIEDPCAVTVEGREFKLDGVEIDGVPFLGFIDRLDLLDDGTLRSIDYKTSKKAPTDLRSGDPHGDQQRLYVMALAELGMNATVAEVMYIRNTVAKSKKVALSAAKMRDTRKRFVKTWGQVNSYVSDQAFPAQLNNFCGWCPLVNACPTAAKAGRVDRLGSAPTVAELPLVERRVVEPVMVDDDLVGVADAIAAEDEAAAAEYRRHLVAAGLIDDTAAAEPAKDGIRRGGHTPAHLVDDNDATGVATKEMDMSGLLTDGKAFEETMQGKLNPASYAAGALFATVGLAVEQLHRVGLVSKSNVEALAHTFAEICFEVQLGITGEESWHGGSHQRARHALRVALDTVPIPWGGDEDAFQAWHASMVTRCRSITTVALDMYDNGVREAAWVSLAGQQPGEVRKPALVERTFDEVLVD